MSAPTRRPLVAAVVAASAATGLLAVAGPATGVTTLTLRSVHSSSLGHNVVATPSGRTLYHRTRETTRHFLCTGSCARIWPPLTVTSRSTRLVKGSGVRGTLGLVRRPRPDGRLQVTLNGLPLYRFSQDRRTGDAKGEGIPGEGSGGGVWHALLASAPRPTTSPPPTTTYPGYNY
jgi:predicted lipoprotein with Yx(FWY)xxD motif